MYVWCHAAEALCSANNLVFSPASVGKAIMSVTHTARIGNWLCWLGQKKNMSFFRLHVQKL